MRALALIATTALIALWAWFALSVADADTRRPVTVEADGKELSAATLNNEGVRLDRRGRRADALAHFERAHDFRPLDPVIAKNVERQRARVAVTGWLTLLVPATVLVAAFSLFVFLAGVVRRVRDRVRLRRLRLRGDPWVRIEKEQDEVELPLHFSEELDGIVKRHPLTIVWSCAGQGKHMKSRPPVRVEGRALKVRLDKDRIERLRRHPGDWKGFLYLGKTPVGETAARVG